MDQISTPPKIRGNFHLQAYEYVKKQIMERIYKPGQYLSDSQIANELNISRTPVRDGLRRLQYEGFLTTQSGKGWKVYSLTLEDIQEIFEIKVELEGLIARKAALCENKKGQSKMSEKLQRMKHAFEMDDLEAWRKADMELHDVIFEMSANERATRIIKDLNDQWYRVRIGLIAMEGRMERANREHQAIVENIIAGNAERAETEMRVHLIKVREELERVLVNLVLPFAQEGVWVSENAIGFFIIVSVRS